ncbi:hypothetical protein ES705_18259 [subsurface metagenome]
MNVSSKKIIGYKYCNQSCNEQTYYQPFGNIFKKLNKSIMKNIVNRFLSFSNRIFFLLLWNRSDL